ncbi:MAG: acyl-ACP--UDP-N-acetylglucosamine O-acyltransferase [Phycisphaerales bacterium]|nr:acyl-ACP--UDP-N-acetylglucosamine O-acyltransferase [Phycisphaerales bacterium]
MPQVHRTAILEGEISLAEDVVIGPYAVIQGRVSLGPGVQVGPHAVIQGRVSVGAGTVLHAHACVGAPAQDLKFHAGSETAGVVIGEKTILREHTTVHAATRTDRATTIGSRVFMMVNTHVGHDGMVGDDVVMVNNSAIGGHARLGPRCTLGGGALVHQFSRIGRLAFVGGLARVSDDVPPFCLAVERGFLMGINAVGLRRSGMARDQITTIRRAFREVFRVQMTKPEMVAALMRIGADCPPVAEMAEFVSEAQRPIGVGYRRRGDADSEEN